MKKNQIVWITTLIVILSVVLATAPATAANDWVTGINSSLQSKASNDLGSGPDIPGSGLATGYNPNQAGVNNVLLIGAVLVVILVILLSVIAIALAVFFLLKYLRRHAFQKKVAEQP